jgi:uncharacterized membrane protein
MSNASSTSAPAGAESAPSSSHRHPLAAVGTSRWVAAASLLGLILLGLAWELWLAPIRPGGSWLALKVLPLCLPLAGLLKNRMYTYRWVSLMVWLYFTEGVVRAWSDRSPGNWLAGIEVLLCLILFVACTVHIRLRLKHGQAQAAALVGAAESQVAS